jgi:hypothetical protein
MFQLDERVWLSSLKQETEAELGKNRLRFQRQKNIEKMKITIRTESKQTFDAAWVYPV